jgi:diamine N-acetyltransferase
MEKKVVLRAVEPSDIDLLYLWENDVSTWYLSNTIIPYSKFLLEEYIANAHLDIYTTKQARFMIEMKDSKIAIGCIDLFDFDPFNNRAGVGILICNEERNKGYATESLELFLRYCFEILLLKQVYCNIISDNDKSINLFKKFNFEIIGLKKKWIRKNNFWLDEYMLQLIND